MKGKLKKKKQTNWQNKKTKIEEKKKKTIKIEKVQG